MKAPWFDATLDEVRNAVEERTAQARLAWRQERDKRDAVLRAATIGHATPPTNFWEGEYRARMKLRAMKVMRDAAREALRK